MTRSGKSMVVALTFAVLAIGAAVLFLVQDSGQVFPNRIPLGEPFPTVVGESLEKVSTELPAALAGRPAVLLVGYKQNAQFDIDRWLMGLLQAEAEAQILEIPTIPGLLPSAASGWIDDGMRSGIPKEDWSAVVTLYGNAARPVAELTGTEEGRIARVLVLDASGVVRWFDDEGYSARKALAVAKLVEELAGA